jgi:hypothetical protein
MRIAAEDVFNRNGKEDLLQRALVAQKVDQNAQLSLVVLVSASVRGGGW